MTLLLAIGCCCAAAVLTALVRRYAVARAVVDLPNERSLHRVPTPRGGGLAVALVVLAAHAGLLGAGLLERGTGLAWGLGAAFVVPGLTTGWKSSL